MARSRPVCGGTIKIFDPMNSSYSTHRWNQYGWFCAHPYMRVIFSLLVAAFSLGLPLAGASPELPSTPAGKVLAGYLEALNSGNKDKLEAFIKAHRPDRPDALDKMFTAVATLQLVERGKLSLDDTIGKSLPDYPNPNVASKVKVRHLLSHTGGT